MPSRSMSSSVVKLTISVLYSTVGTGVREGVGIGVLVSVGRGVGDAVGSGVDVGGSGIDVSVGIIIGLISCATSNVVAATVSAAGVVLPHAVKETKTSK